MYIYIYVFGLDVFIYAISNTAYINIRIFLRKPMGVFDHNCKDLFRTAKMSSANLIFIALELNTVE